jgi:hypothetical protein
MYVLLTRAPLAINNIAIIMLPFDLHVLSLPLAFILSQDQTLHCHDSFISYMYLSFLYISLLVKELFVEIFHLIRSPFDCGTQRYKKYLISKLFEKNNFIFLSLLLYCFLQLHSLNYSSIFPEVQ